MRQQVRAIYGASLSPDATAFAHIVDDGGYPRAVQRFLRGWRASSSRDVELPVEGPVTRVIHSADGHWLACQVAPDGGTRSQIWVVTTDPDDRDAHRIDSWPAGVPEGTAELIGWDGTQVAAILHRRGRRRQLVSDQPGRRQHHRAGPPLGRPVGRRVGRGVAGAGRSARLPRPDHAARPDRNRLAAIGSRLDHRCRRHPRRPPSPPPAVRPGRRVHPAVSPGKAPTDSTAPAGYVRALIRSDNGGEHARLVEVTTTEDGVSYQVVAERPGYDLDEFAVSDDLSTVALLWNINGRSELQILEYADKTLTEPIPLPGPVAGELSISAGGSMVAMTVQGPSMPRDRRTGRSAVAGVGAHRPRAQRWSGCHGSGAGKHHRAGRAGVHRLAVPTAGRSGPGRCADLSARRPRGSRRGPTTARSSPGCWTPVSRCSPRMSAGPADLAGPSSHADDKELRFAAIDDVADCVALPGRRRRRTGKTASPAAAGPTAAT